MEALEDINPDELVKVTPRTIRLRKKLLKEYLRRRDSRECVEESSPYGAGAKVLSLRFRIPRGEIFHPYPSSLQPEDPALAAA